jgi:hypothetical protein
MEGAGEAAASKLDMPGINGSTLVQEMQSLQKDHAIFAFDIDIASAASSPGHYVRNLNAYCFSSGVTDTGSASVPFLTQVVKSQLSPVASDITQHRPGYRVRCERQASGHRGPRPDACPDRSVEAGR